MISHYNAAQKRISIGMFYGTVELELQEIFPTENINNFISFIESIPTPLLVKRQIYKQCIVYLNQEVNNIDETLYKSIYKDNIDAIFNKINPQWCG